MSQLRDLVADVYSASSKNRVEPPNYEFSHAGQSLFGYARIPVINYSIRKEGRRDEQGTVFIHPSLDSWLQLMREFRAAAELLRSEASDEGTVKMTSKQIGKHIGVRERTVFRWIKSEKIKILDKGAYGYTLYAAQLDILRNQENSKKESRNPRHRMVVSEKVLRSGDVFPNSLEDYLLAAMCVVSNLGSSAIDGVYVRLSEIKDDNGNDVSAVAAVLPKRLPRCDSSHTSWSHVLSPGGQAAFYLIGQRSGDSEALVRTLDATANADLGTVRVLAIRGQLIPIGNYRMNVAICGNKMSPHELRLSVSFSDGSLKVERL